MGDEMLAKGRASAARGELPEDDHVRFRDAPPAVPPLDAAHRGWGGVGRARGDGHWEKCKVNLRRQPGLSPGVGRAVSSRLASAPRPPARADGRCESATRRDHARAPGAGGVRARTIRRPRGRPCPLHDTVARPAARREPSRATRSPAGAASGDWRCASQGLRAQPTPRDAMTAPERLALEACKAWPRVMRRPRRRLTCPPTSHHRPSARNGVVVRLPVRGSWHAACFFPFVEGHDLVLQIDKHQAVDLVLPYVRMDFL